MAKSIETHMIANLMMYARPELVEAHDCYWRLIRAALAERGIDSPTLLSQEADEFDVWKAPDLVLSQTCGMPYRLWLHESVTLIGTPDYGLESCPPGHYRSAFVVRADDAREGVGDFIATTFAYNQTFSQSGYAAPYNHLKSRGMWFENRVQSGGHLLSARAVASGSADIAALDAVSWRLIRRYEAFAENLRVLEWTSPTPGLPYIAAAGVNQKAVFEAVKDAIAQLPPEHQEALGFKALIDIPKTQYLAIPNPEGAEIRAEGL